MIRHDRLITMLFCLAVMLCGYAYAAESNPRLPDGTSAPEIPGDEDYYDKPPIEADATGKPSCQAPRKYVDIIRAGKYDLVGSLFSDDAVFLTPTGQTVRGKAIGQFYAKFLSKTKPSIIPVSFIQQGPDCIMELAAIDAPHTTPNIQARYRLAAIDHFTVNAEGKVVRMIVYLRPSSSSTIQSAK